MLKRAIKIVLGILAGLFALLLVLAIVLPTPETTSGAGAQTAASDPPASPAPAPVVSAPDRIKSLNSKLTEVREAGEGTLTIRYSPKSIWSGDAWVRSFLIDALEILAKLDSAAPGHRYQTVHFFAELPTTDNLGREGKSVGMEVTYKLADFTGANWKGMNHWNMADLASDVDFRRLGLESAVEFCKEEDNARYASRFCSRVVARLMSRKG